MGFTLMRVTRYIILYFSESFVNSHCNSIDLSHNSIAHLPSGLFGRSVSIESIHFGENNITNWGKQTFQVFSQVSWKICVTNPMIFAGANSTSTFTPAFK